MSYYDRYIVLDNQASWKNTDGNALKRWDCFLKGEIVGAITWREKPGRWEKSFYVEAHGENYGDHFTTVGSYDSLAKAKQALQKPAAEWLDYLARPKQFSPAAFLPSGDFQFYPTPSDVAGKLFTFIDWRKVNSILEPSAGRGDLLDYLESLKRMDYKHRSSSRRFWPADRKYDVDCIEIDPNLQALLTGKGQRVIHDDFLTFDTRKCYDLILMNPPFSDGDLHLLHALELLRSGGQVACILNAETIRNPYTVSRKALLKELHRLGATIKFYEDAFSKADRRARVDIAIVYARLPEKQTDASMWDDLKKAHDTAWDQARPEKNELAPSNNVERMIREYDLLCAAGIKLIQAYNGIAPHIFSSRSREYTHPLIRLEVNGHSSVNDYYGSQEVNEFLTAARARYWRELFDLPDVQGKMTTDMKKEYDSTIQEMREYEFSEFNIRQVLKKIMGQISVGVEDAIEKCFDKLSAEHAYHDDVQNENVHYYNGWKTNKAHYVNMRCIIPTWGCFATEYKADKYNRYKSVMTGLNVNGCFGVLDDLEKALDYLDKGETQPTDLLTQLNVAARAGRTAGISCKYFTVKFFKKGTCHIQFHEQKIVDRLNIFMGRKRAWLPPSYGKKSYSTMTPEEKTVIDSFQGKEKYARIMEDTKDYLIEPAEQGAFLLAE